MSDTSKLRKWSESDREQADAISYLAAIGKSDARASLSKSQAESLHATADGWDEISQAIDDGVDDPNKH